MTTRASLVRRESSICRLIRARRWIWSGHRSAGLKPVCLWWRIGRTLRQHTLRTKIRPRRMCRDCSSVISRLLHRVFLTWQRTISSLAPLPPCYWHHSCHLIKLPDLSQFQIIAGSRLVHSGVCRRWHRLQRISIDFLTRHVKCSSVGTMICWWIRRGYIPHVRVRVRLSRIGWRIRVSVPLSPSSTRTTPIEAGEAATAA